MTSGAAGAQTLIDRTSTSTTANTSVSLPGAVQNYGQDEVQAAGGVACRASVSNGGAFLDSGVVGANDFFGRQTTSAYARVVVPLGKAPKRLDCNRLYELEIERLKLELAAAKMSLPPMAMEQAPSPRAPME